MNKIKIAASILSADFANLGQEVRKVTEAGADLIHIDVMDNHFVPNLTFGPFILKAIRKYSELPFDVHLMTNNTESLIEQFADAGADRISIHPESVIHLDRALDQIKTMNIKAGVALNPSTNPESIKYVLDKIDYILIMTVNPGFAGQSFLNSQIEKISYIKENFVSKYNIEIAVDGGINSETSKIAARAGADTLIAGSYIFNNQKYDYRDSIKSLSNPK